MIELYGNASPNVLKIVLMLEELGLPYRMGRVDIWTGETFQTEFRKLNPNGKVPILVDPDGPGSQPFTLFESGAILMYLADKTGRFWPAEMRARHTVTQWLMIQMGGVGPMFGQNMHFSHFAPPDNDYAQGRYRTAMLRLCEVLDRRLGESPWLAGDDYTIADIATWPWTRIHELLGIPIADYPNLGRWNQTIAARPAGARMAAMSDEMVPAELASATKAQPDNLDRLFGRGRWTAA